ncbi:hypothetical protein EDL81_03975 [Ehrlichia ruminantium]|uniref:hypothetical protein n=1 Tax=Ehrlichia ruminantium TaxID=779 RepID=UPI00130DCE57|nr:hypothetical protein [Ehrlichia ruminantium]QGR02776.1 hypothetical protein EDL81_03975 [Ehrlichia ruminantium]
MQNQYLSLTCLILWSILVVSILIHVVFRYVMLSGKKTKGTEGLQAFFKYAIPGDIKANGAKNLQEEGSKEVIGTQEEKLKKSALKIVAQEEDEMVRSNSSTQVADLQDKGVDVKGQQCKLQLDAPFITEGDQGFGEQKSQCR